MTVSCSVMTDGSIKMFLNDTNLDLYLHFNTTMAFRSTELPLIILYSNILIMLALVF